jgi:hypothetical protein
MLAVRPNAKDRLRAIGGRRLALKPVPWQRAALCLLAAAALTGFFAAVGAPLWLSVCVGALAGLRVLAGGSAGGRGARAH